jgi:hypothetical protein
MIDDGFVPGMIDALDRMIDDIFVQQALQQFCPAGTATIARRTDGMIDALPKVWTE